MPIAEHENCATHLASDPLILQGHSDAGLTT